MLTTAFVALRRSLVPAETPDGDLVRAYAERNDVDAFAVLVARHGPSVYGVCRRTLGETPDADDAFQATFLVLIRRASTLADPNRVGSWLFGVAVRTSGDARRRRQRRFGREQTLHDVFPCNATKQTNTDALSLIDAEIARLSDTLRAAIVLWMSKAGIAHLPPGNSAFRKEHCPAGWRQAEKFLPAN